MTSRILIVDGHPDGRPERLCRQLSSAYAEGAIEAGHEIRRIDLATADFPWLKTHEDYENGTPPPFIADAQGDIAWASHVVFVLPIWLGTAPAIVKAFLEQTMRPGFAREKPKAGETLGRKRMTGRSVRIVATMGMPAIAYRLYFMQHGLANMSDNILKFVGFGPVRWTLVGNLENPSAKRIAREVDAVRALGRAAR